MKDGVNGSAQPDLHDLQSVNINSNGKPRDHFNTEKFGHHLLMNSDSKTALAAAKLSSGNATDEI
jgi:hypothetical protein